MPDIIAHYRFGEAVFAALPEDVRACIDRGVFDHATAGPDIWFTYRFWHPSVAKPITHRGSVMHSVSTGAFLRALAETLSTDATARNAMFSYLAGFLCHYALDQTAHPYIIYRTGEYDKTAATIQNRGNHMYMEHALDLLALRQWGVSLRDRPITRRILRLRSLPAEMRVPLNSVYESIYGWRGAWEEINRGIDDQRRFYALAQDPSGLLDAILRRVDDGKSDLDLTAISYFGKERPELDAANEAKLLWHHPNDATKASHESFADLNERAKALTVGWITQTSKAAQCGAAVPDYGDASYTTGFPLNDPRNREKRQCEPLQWKRIRTSKG